MKTVTHKKFEKVFKQIPQKIQNKFYQQLRIFQCNKYDQRLRNHSLVGRYLGYRSMDIIGDWRIIFKEIDNETIKLVNIGTHSELYG
ncbi:type II toxin-antitoxin system mRNA interferase toxin, RelE/StbE family [Candidatus Azambacteria bacterium]|nr:type II toxin-antitoxin system mRNA interferase toxin, RelE/StbE family [Candidatus Azambacteria bacterium]